MSRERRRAGTPWWVWLLGLLLVGLVAFMIFQGMDSDTSSDAGSGEGVQLGTGDGAATGDDSTGIGTVSSGSVDLLSLSSDADSLARYEDQSVQGTSAPVQSVVGDETFWVGESERERLFVFLNLQGESGPDIDAGDEVTFDGTVKALPIDFDERFDLSAEEGADQLEGQGRFIEVTSIQQG